MTKFEGFTSEDFCRYKEMGDCDHDPHEDGCHADTFRTNANAKIAPLLARLNELDKDLVYECEGEKRWGDHYFNKFKELAMMIENAPTVVAEGCNGPWWHSAKGKRDTHTAKLVMIEPIKDNNLGQDVTDEK